MRTAGSQGHYFTTSFFGELTYVLRSAFQKEKLQLRTDALDSIDLTRMQKISHFSQGRHVMFYSNMLMIWCSRNIISINSCAA